VKKTLLALAASAATAGCLAAAGVTSPPAPRPDAVRCASTEIRALVVRFVSAFNYGESDLLDRVYAREPDFRWYSTDGPGRRLRLAASDRSSLLRYFAKRHADGERLSVRSLRFMGNTVAPSLKPYGNFVFRLVRSTNSRPPMVFRGKGAAHCYPDEDQIIVWSMARATE
jgi:hypothetical protein